jgi:hypothetical protein
MKLGSNVEHPDQHEIDDWFLYGPQNRQIEALVRRLTIDRGLRLKEVEEFMVDALIQKCVNSSRGGHSTS